MSSRENSVTSLISEYLRGHNLDVNTFEGIEIPNQGVKEPDFTIRNGGTFLGEAKWESEYNEGLVEAHDYSKAPKANGVFVIGYPEELKEEIQQARLGTGVDSVLSGYEYRVTFLHEDRQTDMTTKTLDEIPEWLNGHIAGQLEPQIDADEVISVLRQTADALTQEMAELDAMDLFENVLGVDAEEEEKVNAAKRVTGYLLINQLTFYRVLSAVSDYDPIDPQSLTSPDDLMEYFEAVLEDDYTPIFSFPVAEAYSQEHLPLIRDAVKRIYLLNPDQINHEVLGDIFHRLIPFSLRKAVAAFYTKNEAAQILGDIAVQNEGDTVLDPACGSGTLLTAAYRSKRSKTKRWGKKKHEQFLEEDITGLDIMPFAAHLSTIHLALQQPKYPTDRVRVGIEDSTKVQPGDEIPPLSHMLPEDLIQRTFQNYDKSISEFATEEVVEKGSIHRKGMEQEPLNLESVDLVMMNPPYSRQESIANFDKEYKSKLKKKRLRSYKRHIHGLMSFYSYFFLIADRFLENSGRVAAVIPQGLLNKDSDSGIRNLLTKKYNIEYIFLRNDQTNFSEDTDFREIMLIAQKGHEEESATNYVRLNTLDVRGDKIQTIADSMESGDHEEYNDLAIQKVDTDKLNPENLFTPFAVENPDLLTTWENIIDSEKVTTLDNLNVGRIGGVRGGADDARGYNPHMTINSPDAYNIKDGDSWVLADETEDTVIAKEKSIGDMFEIPKDCVVPNLRGFSGRSTADVSDLSEYAVVKRFEDFDQFESLTGVQDPIPVEKWEGKVNSRIAHLALVRRANLTAPGLRHMAYYSEDRRLGPNIMWMLTNLNTSEAKILGAWFDSTIGWLQFLLDRLETEGSFSAWRGYIAEKFRTLNLFNLDGEDKKELTVAFEQFKDIETGSLAQQLAASANEDKLSSEQTQAIEQIHDGVSVEDDLPERKELDKTVLNVLGFSKAEQDEILEDLYIQMLKEFLALKEVMRE